MQKMLTEKDKVKKVKKQKKIYPLLKRGVVMLLKKKKKYFHKNTLRCSGKAILKKWQKRKHKRLGNSCL